MTWPTLTIDEIKAPGDRSIAIGPFGSRMKSDRYVSHGVPVIRGNNLTDGREFTGDFVYVSEATADELRASNVYAGDLVFPHRGAIGEVGIVAEDGTPRYMLSTSLMKLTCNRELIDPRFVYYFFKSTLGRQSLLQHASVVGTPGIGQPLSSLRSIRIPVPPLRAQHAIVSTLGSLDDKIELNRRMSQTLEEIARALFKSWFVDFDPVHAKAAGREPVGMDAETAALFPNEFEESELGLIPKGWSIAPLDQIAAFLNGLALQKFPVLGDESLPAIKIAQLKRGSTEGADRVGTNVPDAYVVHDGDILFSWSGSLELVIWHGGTGALNQHLFKVTPKDLPDWFVYFWIDRHLPAFREIAADTATTMGHIQRRHLTEARTVLPSAPVLCHAERALGPMFRRAIDAQAESGTLAELRDILLPRLISGELASSLQGTSRS